MVRVVGEIMAALFLSVGAIPKPLTQAGADGIDRLVDIGLKKRGMAG